MRLPAARPSWDTQVYYIFQKSPRWYYFWKYLQIISQRKVKHVWIKGFWVWLKGSWLLLCLQGSKGAADVSRLPVKSICISSKVPNDVVENGKCIPVQACGCVVCAHLVSRQALPAVFVSCSCSYIPRHPDRDRGPQLQSSHLLRTMVHLRPGLRDLILVDMLLLHIFPITVQGVDPMSLKLRRLTEQVWASIALFVCWY